MKKVGRWLLIVLIIVLLIGITIFVTNYVMHSNGPQEIAKGENESKNENTNSEKQMTPIEDLPLDYTIEQAMKDHCFVAVHGKAYNFETLESFMENVKNKKEDSLQIVEVTIEGDLIITQLDYKINTTSGDGYYILKTDARRDNFAAGEDKKIKTNDDIPGIFYTIHIQEKDNVKTVMLALTAQIDYENEEGKKYEDISLCSYSTIVAVPEMEETPSFFGKVITSDTNYIMVEPNEGEQIRKAADKVYIGLGKDNDAIYEVGTNVKITYTGDVRETYPLQLDALNIELKSVDDFELRFYDKHPQTDEKLHTILSAKEDKLYPYNIYAYDGQVNILIKGEEISLKDALLSHKITMNDILSKANHDFPEAISYDDGGSMEYHYPNYTIIKVHNLDGNRDVYIGPKDLNINDLEIK